MIRTKTYTSNLNIELMNKLNHYSTKYGIPKSQIIEKALQLYIEQLKREEYLNSFIKAKNDMEQLELAETGLDDYINMID